MRVLIAVGVGDEIPLSKYPGLFLGMCMNLNFCVLNEHRFITT